MRRRALLLLSVLAGTALAVPAGPAAAAACGDGTGVTVVVDFASLGGGSPQRCAAGDPASGVAALRAAGFTPTRAAQEPGYFVCRIDGKPAKDPCQRTSPADAYWSYWHAKPGGSWTYSSTGANDFDPAPGTVDGWAFGAGKPPSAPPPRAAPATAQPAASHAPVSAAARPGPTAAAPVAPPAPRATAAARPAGPTPRAVPAPSTPDPVDPPGPESRAATAAPAAAPATDSGGSPAGPVTAAVVVGVLIAAAARTVFVRRRNGDG
jgi:hypothetical protein